MTIESTGTFVQHSDDLARDISNAVLEWERRNPGKRVTKIHFELRDAGVEDKLAPYAHVTTSTRSKERIESKPEPWCPTCELKHSPDCEVHHHLMPDGRCSCYS